MASGRNGYKAERARARVWGRAYRSLVLMQHLVVSAERHAENDGRHVLETVDPLLPLWPLTSHIEQPDKQGERMNKQTHHGGRCDHRYSGFQNIRSNIFTSALRLFKKWHQKKYDEVLFCLKWNLKSILDNWLSASLFFLSVPHTEVTCVYHALILTCKHIDIF